MQTKISNPIREFYQKMRAESKIIPVSEKELALTNSRISKVMENSDREYSRITTESSLAMEEIILTPFPAD